MITFPRRQARRLRSVFRRHALGLTHKGAMPPWSLSPTRPSGSESDIISPIWPSRRSSEAPRASSSPCACPWTP